MQDCCFSFKKKKLLSNTCNTCTVESRSGSTSDEGDERQFELARGNSGYRRKFNWNIYQGKTNLVRVSAEFELSEFELSRFYCTSLTVENNNTKNFQHFFCYERLLANSVFQTIFTFFSPIYGTDSN